MSDVLSKAEVQRIWREQHREDGSLIPLSEIYHDTYLPPVPVKSHNQELIEWFERRLDALRSGKISDAHMALTNADFTCALHEGCTVYQLHCFNADADDASPPSVSPSSTS